MNPNAVNRVAIAATVSAAVLAVAVVAGGRRYQQTSISAPIPAVAMDEQRVAADMARAEAEMARTEAEAQRVSIDAERTAEIQAEATDTEDEAVEANDREDELNKIRQAAKDYVKNALPDTKPDGVFLLPLHPESLFIAGVDTQLSDGKRRTIDLLVRRYVRKIGNTYWRAESLDGGQNTVIQTKRPN